MTYSDDYMSRTQGSNKHFLYAKEVIPGGATRSLNSWHPYPIYLKEASGSHITDLDENQYVDFLGNYTALVHGHKHSSTMHRIQEQITRGLSLSFATELEYDLAMEIVRRVPSVEKIRFMNSGTEAVMFATRLARLHTGRRLIAKMEGGYHGTHDTVSVSVRPSSHVAGDIQAPVGIPESEALSPSISDETIVLPFNHIQESRDILASRHQDIAAVIVEPMLGVGGMIPPIPGYLEALREVCTMYGILLIFDEVITFRLSEGGGQSYFNVVPDVTAMGKIIGGGMPIGAMGGRCEIMDLMEPQGGTDVYDARTGGPKLYQGGTFTGHPLSMAAGLGTLECLFQENIRSINELGNQIRREINTAAQRHKYDAYVTGAGSLFHIHMTAQPIKVYRDIWAVNNTKQQQFFMAMLERGYLIAPRGMGSVSTAILDQDAEAFVASTVAAIKTL